MKTSILLFVTLLTAGSVFSQTKTVSGATFKSQMDIKGAKLVYNGAGLREKYTIDIYVAALYFPNQTMNSSAVIGANEIQAINIELVSNKVTRERFNATVKEGSGKVTDGKATASNISAFTGFFSSELKKETTS
ncbi:MAG: chalcone isomerase family protein [Crocinitomicaceae bacterium]|nr:chalcone isomerase family protein [Crocinitomicaceae bacterium]